MCNKGCMAELDLSAHVRALHIIGAEVQPPSLAEVVAWLERMGRKKDVDWVEAEIALSRDLRVPVAVRERGKVVSVDFDDKRRRYALSVDGLQSAIADWIREQRGADPALLDLFEQLLLRG